MMASRMFIRSMATASKSVKPPVQLFGLDGTYASALYTAAAKDSTIEKAATSIQSLTQLLSGDKSTSHTLSNPALSADDRKIVVDTLSSKVQLDSTVVNLLKVLAENNRLSLLPGISKQFSVLNDAHKGVVEAIVTSTKPLDSKILKRLSTAIQDSKYVGQGKTLKIKNEVDPEILGGLVVEIADNTVDLSVSSKIAKLNKILNESI
ncbi:hypothetical protein PACTADRAFT_49287 [Pachysolen tannophilus NRRL Y-2460]|uniref:ATP synthase subunit 5, mitochondrial n=1 Tax=Pachysolen tannophilus NRRL Y-2460 TaxID=669874 RepID=A0A1E4TVQ9_PACTA|nr:hypothetical protein PACTADRAFT_49287 [Pachysolen tannophilus NRRL Y-2460]